MRVDAGDSHTCVSFSTVGRLKRRIQTNLRNNVVEESRLTAEFDLLSFNFSEEKTVEAERS